MVIQSSRRTLPRLPHPAVPARSFNERTKGIMRKIYALTRILSDSGVQVQAALLIQTPNTKFTYESKDGMLRDFNTDLPEENRFRPDDVKNLFGDRTLACSSIGGMSPMSDRSGRSSPALSASSTASSSSAPLPLGLGLSFPPLPSTQPAGQDTTTPGFVPESPLPAPETGATLPTSPAPPEDESLSPSFPNIIPGLSLTSDVPPPTSTAMDISNLVNLESWLAASDVPSPDSIHRPLLSSRPIRTTPPPSATGRSGPPSPYRVLKISAAPKHKRSWFVCKGTARE